MRTMHYSNSVKAFIKISFSCIHPQSIKIMLVFSILKGLLQSLGQVQLLEYFCILIGYCHRNEPFYERRRGIRKYFINKSSVHQKLQK